MMTTSQAKYILCKMLVPVSLLRKDFFSQRVLMSKYDKLSPIFVVHVGSFVVGLIISYFILEAANLTVIFLFKIVLEILHWYGVIIIFLAIIWGGIFWESPGYKIALRRPLLKRESLSSFLYLHSLSVCLLPTGSINKIVWSSTVRSIFAY